jgi:sensor histidine kinase regulating citrate/malate metabolism
MAEKKIRFVGGIPETTKQDKGGHGFGMRSIRQIVNAHNGHMLIETEGETFRFTVYLKGF